MTVKIILYVLIFPLTLVAMDSLNFEKLLKKNKVFQARMLYLLLSLAISYLAVSFIYDFYMNTQLI